ncbi:bacteriohemerythrin [Tepidibacillus fermentans]|uniref:Hemerythrin n=1 Tax=Tepidibacillus fermentans TaxID=1281767 RepID=A0A4R3K900_9BACI|nr:bacteriohemerythrin [Tepidibacillus fermentans]TCS79407.1 hemerythrin [Tepidibacillus fermentans]
MFGRSVKNTTISDRPWKNNSVRLDCKEESVVRKLQLLNISEETLKIMREQKQLFEENVDRIVKSFYDKIYAIQHLKNIIDKHSTIERLMLTQKRYLLSLTDGVIDQNYVENRRIIGKVHDRIRLQPEWFFGAYQVMYRSIFPLLVKKYENYPDLAEVLLAFTNLTTFDIQLVEETYIESYTSKMLQMDEIHKIEQELTATGHTMVANAEETSSSVQEMANVSIGIAEASSLATDHAKKVQEVAQQGAETVYLTQEKMNDIVNKMTELQNKAQEIHAGSEKIGEIISLIHGIAKQTNILALNASIESARAGEHGRGFAVVANEVKNLAGRTQKALEDITNLILLSQQSVQAMLEVVASTNETVLLGNQQMQKLQEELKEMVTGIDSNLQQISTINQQVEQFTAMSEELASASQEVAELAGNLNDLSESLAKKIQDTEHNRVEPIQWTANLEVGVPEIDRQHKELVDRLNRFIIAFNNGEEKEEVGNLLKFLENYIIEHFQDEEALQRKYNYPDYDQHKKIHDQFIKTVQNYREQFDKEGVNTGFVIKMQKTLMDWLLNHISKVDSLVGHYIRDVRGK